MSLKRHLFINFWLMVAPTPAFAGEVVKSATGYDIIKIEAVKDSKGLVQEPAKEYHTGLLHGHKEFADAPVMQLTQEDCAGMPDAYDLASEVPNPVPETRDQGQCGSCGMFSKSGAFESWLITNGKAQPGVNLSEQEMVSCDDQNWGCGGSLLNEGDNHYQRAHGQGLESDFPYTSGSTGRTGSCKNIPVAYKAEANYELVKAVNGMSKDKAAACALWKYKDIPWTTVGADGDWDGRDGEKLHTRCSNSGTNHAIGHTKYRKAADGVYEFWIRNSWGKGWGVNGGMWIRLGCDGYGDEIAHLVPSLPKPAFSFQAPLEVVAWLSSGIAIDAVGPADASYRWSTGDTGKTLWLKKVSSQSITVTGTKGDVSASTAVKVTAL